MKRWLIVFGILFSLLTITGLTYALTVVTIQRNHLRDQLKMAQQPQQAKETVEVKLPSGEIVDAIVPVGLSDAQVRALMQQKHPELFPRKAR